MAITQNVRINNMYKTLSYVNPHLSRSITFFKKQPEPPKELDSLIKKFDRGAERFQTAHTKLPVIDTVDTGDLSHKGVTSALLINAIQNNQTTQALDHIVRTLKTIKYRMMIVKKPIFKQLSHDIYETILWDMQQGHPMNFAQIVALHEALPAYRQSLKALKFDPSLLAGWYVYPDQYFFDEGKEQFIAAEYNQLHQKEGLRGVEAVIDDLLAKKKLFTMQYPNDLFSLNREQVLMPVEDYQASLNHSFKRRGLYLM